MIMVVLFLLEAATIPHSGRWRGSHDVVMRTQGCRSVFLSEGTGDEWQAPVGLSSGG